jgi:hypothetical protein
VIKPKVGQKIAFVIPEKITKNNVKLPHQRQRVIFGEVVNVPNEVDRWGRVKIIGYGSGFCEYSIENNLSICDTLPKRFQIGNTAKIYKRWIRWEWCLNNIGRQL